MEKKDKDQIYPIYDIEAPPVLIPLRNSDNIINNNNNINNLNINKGNINLFQNNNNIIKIDDIKKFHQINNNNKVQHNTLLSFNNNYFYNPQNNILKNQLDMMYLSKLNYLNYINRQQQNNILNSNNNININNNNFNIISNNLLIKNYPLFFDFKIDIEQEILYNLDKKNLLDIIIFIMKYCKIKIDQRFINLKHHTFKIKSNINKENEYLFYMKKNKENNILSKINKQNIEADDRSDDSHDNANIINENNNNLNNKNKINISKNNPLFKDFYCPIHNKVYFINQTVEEHFNEHVRCEICNEIFPKRRKLRNHMRTKHNKAHLKNYENKKSKSKIEKNENINNILDNDKIKCTECELIFNSIESMSSHFYEIHEKQKSNINIMNKDKNNPKLIEILKIKELENKKKEQQLFQSTMIKELKSIEELKKKGELKKQMELDRQKNEEIKRKSEELKRQELIKKQTELKKQEELKKEEEIKKQEKKRQEELKREEELNKNEEIKKQEDIQIEIDQYNVIKHYKCYIDKKAFISEREYVEHFRKYHKNDYPFYCEKCNKGFYSYQSSKNHNKLKHYYY